MKVQRMTIRIVTLLALSASLLGVSWGQSDSQPAGGSPEGMPPGGAMEGMPEGGGMPEPKHAQAVYIDNGQYMADKSKPANVSGGKLTGAGASGIKILSKEKNFGGLVVKGGKSIFTLSDSAIDLYGDGDSEGTAVGASVQDGAILILKNVKITTNGLSSSTLNVSNRSMLKVFDSTLRANGGTPDPKVKYPVWPSPGGLGAPTPLKLEGYARDTLVVNRSEAYYYNSTIISDGWGALSTDAAEGYVYLEANDCDIRTIKAGYGTYADVGATVVINNSKMNNGGYAGIIAGEASITLNNVSGTSGRNAVMIHNVSRDGSGAEVQIGTLKIKGGHLVAEKAGILIKSANADISLDGAELVAKNGVLIQSMINDDSGYTKTHGKKVSGIRVKLKNENLEGNIIHEDTEREMALTFTASTLKGSVKNASLTLNAGSKWMATGDSKVVLSGKTDVASIDAPAGVSITATAGKDCTLSGSYNLASGGVLKVE